MHAAINGNSTTPTPPHHPSPHSPPSLPAPFPFPDRPPLAPLAVPAPTLTATVAIGMGNLVVHEHSRRHRHYVTPAERRELLDATEQSTHRASSLLAALLVPFTVLFSLPGLTEGWSVEIDILRVERSGEEWRGNGG